MMWLLPAVIGIIGTVPIVVAVRRVAKEAIGLRREIVRFSELRPALVELRSNATMTRDAAVAAYRRGMPRP